MPIERGPATGYGVTLTDGASDNTKGDWEELIASTSDDADGITVNIQGMNSGPRFALADIGVGGAGSETAVIENIMFSNNGIGSTLFGQNIIAPFFPLGIASGTRISARFQTNNQPVTVRAVVFVAGETQGSGTITTYGADTSDSGGTTIDPGGVADTDGDWIELTSSTSDDHDYLTVIFSARANGSLTGAAWLVDIGTGAEGAETVLIADLVLQATSSEFLGPLVFHLPITIASGTRIAMRAQCTITDATARLIDAVIYAATDSQSGGGAGGGAFAAAYFG